MLFSVMPDKEYASCKQAKAELQSILSDIDWILRNREGIRAYFPYNGDGSLTYKVLDWGTTEDEEDIISFNRQVEKFDGFYLNGNKVNFHHIMVTIEEAERLARLDRMETDTPTTDTEDQPDLSYPTPETMGLVADLKSQRAQIKECLEVGVCPKCGKPGIDYQTFPILHYLCKSCGWDWEERE